MILIRFDTNETSNYGYTYSSNFPTVDAYNSTLGGSPDCFVTKLASDGQSLVYSTFLGGGSNEWGQSIAVQDGYAYVTGFTYSSDFPTVNAYDSTHNGSSDFLVTKIATDGPSLTYSTYLGGNNDDEGQDIAVENGHTYVTGYTWSSDFPTTSAYNSTHGGNRDCVVAILSQDSDSDGLLDWEEDIFYDCDPYCIDTDNDNFLDGYEVEYDTNPTNPAEYPAMPQVWYDKIYENLDGNATLLQQVLSWLDGNHRAIETLFTYVEGNATLLQEAVVALDGNATQLGLVAALATDNQEWLQSLNSTAIGNITEIREVLDQLGVTVGDTDCNGLDDLDEIAEGTDIQCIDTDCDNLNDAYEIEIGTDPLEKDTDQDGYDDGHEIMSGTNPLDAADHPGTGVSTVILAMAGTAAIVVLIAIVLFILWKQRASS
ncbi:MAG: SBBP repeat-containing protein [Candidatus Thorarchaeota archaeon]